MKSLDTNVLARFYAKDDPAQSDIAFRIMVDEPSLFVTKTVVLELFWVLSKSPTYKMSAEIVHSAIRHLISMRNVMVEDYDAVDRALEWSGRESELLRISHIRPQAVCGCCFKTGRYGKTALHCSRISVSITVFSKMGGA